MTDMTSASMPSRVADALYWSSRYLERADHLSRVLSVQLDLALDRAPRFAPLGWICVFNTLQRGELPVELSTDDRAATYNLAFDRQKSSSLVNCLRRARENARGIREHLTAGMWLVLNHIYVDTVERGFEAIWDEGPLDYLGQVQQSIRLFSSYADTNMERAQAWHFLRLGRAVERATTLSSTLATHAAMGEVANGDLPTAGQHLAWASLLRSCSAYEAYCHRYTLDLRIRHVLELLLLAERFPYSLRFAAREIEDCVQGLSACVDLPGGSNVEATAQYLSERLAAVDLDGLNDVRLRALLTDVSRCSRDLSDVVVSEYIERPSTSQQAAQQ